MQFYWTKTLTTISMVLIVTISANGCESSNRKVQIPITNNNPGQGNVANSFQVEANLNDIEQSLILSINSITNAINFGDKMQESTLASFNCKLVIISQAKLQDLVIKGQISAENVTLKRIVENIQQLRLLSKCNN
ncbi:hypothetical protein GS682_05625 [Nostoc sp. B(2019)]|nr:hypothetical protein [Nostoc sp. B(2019)]